MHILGFLSAFFSPLSLFPFLLYSFFSLVFLNSPRVVPLGWCYTDVVVVGVADWGFLFALGLVLVVLGYEAGFPLLGRSENPMRKDKMGSEWRERDGDIEQVVSITQVVCVGGTFLLLTIQLIALAQQNQYTRDGRGRGE